MGGQRGATKNDQSLSVIIAAYNAEKVIERCLRSLANQSESDRLEVIVVDDGSTDATVRLVEEFPLAVSIASQSNTGPSAARNTGATKANGSYLAFLDADDEVHPDWSESLGAAFEASPAAVCCGLIKSYIGRGRETRSLPRPLGPAYYDTEGWYDTGSYAVRADIFDAIGGFATDIPFGEHNELALRLTKHCHENRETIATVDRALVFVHLDRQAQKHQGYSKSRIVGSRRRMERHRSQMARDPAMTADHHAIIGVALVQDGKPAEARAEFFAAWRAAHRPRDAARLLISLVSPLAERIWAHPSNRPLDSTDISVGSQLSDSHEGTPKMISVVIPAYNAADTLAEQLDSLTQQDYEGRWEVIVSDNGSTDDTATIARSYEGKLPIRVVDASVQQGYSVAANTGAWAAEGDFLAFCDADDVVVSGWLTAWAEAAPSADMFGGWCNTEPLNEGPAKMWRPSPPPDTLLDPLGFGSLVPSGNMGVWTSHFRALGGFREDLGSVQDMDFSLRGHLGGYRVAFVPEAEIHYRYRDDLWSFTRQMYEYAFHSERIRREYRNYLSDDAPELTAKKLAWLALRVPYLAVSSHRRGLWIRVAVTTWGRTVGRVWWFFKGMREASPRRETLSSRVS